MRTEIGRPRSSMRLSAWTATSTSVARRWSVCAQLVADHLLEPGDVAASARARFV